MFVLLQGKYKECDRELNIWNVFEVKYFSSKRVPQIHFRTWYDIEHIQIHTSTTNIVLVYSLIVHSLQTIKHSAYLLFSYKLFICHRLLLFRSKRTPLYGVIFYGNEEVSGTDQHTELTNDKGWKVTRNNNIRNKIKCIIIRNKNSCIIYVIHYFK